MVSKVTKPRAIKIKRAVDESDDGDDTESEEFARRSAIIAQANYDDQPTEKKYALNEIEEPELQNLYRLSQNVFDLEARDVKVDPRIRDALVKTDSESNEEANSRQKNQDLLPLQNNDEESRDKQIVALQKIESLL